MDEMQVQTRSESLDPQNWSEFRQFAHKLLDDAIDYSARINEQPVWRGVPDSVKRDLQKAAPDEGENAERVYQDFRNLVLPYVYANTHPRAWGWVIGAGTTQGIAHQIWATALNSNVFGAEQSPDYVEEQVLSWLKEKMGFPPDSSGLLVSGTSIATLTALAIARTATLGKRVLSGGLQEEQRRAALYCSREAHLSVEKSVAILGMGTNSLRRIAVDKKFRIVIPELQSAISEDRRNGYFPLCVIGNAGTVNTGATDDLEQLAAICERERLWFHVDGAFGFPKNFRKGKPSSWHSRCCWRFWFSGRSGDSSLPL